MIPIISFVGISGCGKTTLLEQVVRDLTSRGYRVAVVKHSHHHLDVDQEGKDTWRFASAGAHAVAISTAGQIAIMERVTGEMDLVELVRFFSSRADIVLTEGYKSGDNPKILVSADNHHELPFQMKGEILARVCPRGSQGGIPLFDSSDISGIVSLLVHKISGNGYLASSHETLMGPAAVMGEDFKALLRKTAEEHGHLCAGQVLGVRMALLGCRELGISSPRDDGKRLIVYVEIDRCATDAIQAVTGCRTGKRTMKLVDYGKLAATFVDLRTGRAVRVAAREDARTRSPLYCAQASSKSEIQTAAYQVMPDEELFDVQQVLVQISSEDMPGPPTRRVTCHSCGEGINDGREVRSGEIVLCRACANGSYYVPLLNGDMSDSATLVPRALA